MKIEVLTLPVADVDRALRFYTSQVGFVLDVDYRPSPSYQVVQLTPPGSATSVQFGVGLTDAAPGSVRTTYLVVDDIEATYGDLSSRGVKMVPLKHKTPGEDWHGDYSPSLDPNRRTYATFTGFTDPDGNTWIVQEVH